VLEGRENGERGKEALFALLFVALLCLCLVSFLAASARRCRLCAGERPRRGRPEQKREREKRAERRKEDGEEKEKSSREEEKKKKSSVGAYSAALRVFSTSPL
jgi:hypothetical protein